MHNALHEHDYMTALGEKKTVLEQTHSFDSTRAECPCLLNVRELVLELDVCLIQHFFSFHKHSVSVAAGQRRSNRKRSTW